MPILGNMRLHLPNSAFLGNLDPFLRNLVLSEPEKMEITANKRWLSLHPVVLCIIAALGLRTTKIHCERLEAKSKHYLERMGVFRMLHISSGINIQEHEPAGRFVPLSQIKNSPQLNSFMNEIVPLLHLAPSEAEPIKYVIGELVRNVFEHAASESGALVCAQYYKKSNSIKIGIADVGIGIRKTINQSHFAATDLDAIRLALTPGVTGTTSREGGTEYNAGAGLFFIKSLAKLHRNFFLVYSGSAMYKLLKESPGKHPILYSDPFKDRHSAANDYPVWKGTVIGIDLSLDTSLEFSSFLGLAGKALVKAIKERKKEKYRPKVKFI